MSKGCAQGSLGRGPFSISGLSPGTLFLSSLIYQACTSLSSFKSKLKTHLFSSAYWFVFFLLFSTKSITTSMCVCSVCVYAGVCHCVQFVCVHVFAYMCVCVPVSVLVHVYVLNPCSTFTLIVALISMFHFLLLSHSTLVSDVVTTISNFNCRIFIYICSESEPAYQ